MAAPRNRRNDAKLDVFAAELAKGRTAVDAARAAGYSGSSMASNAKRRAQLPSVKASVAELRREATANTVITVERLIGNLEEARLLAMQIEQPSAANGCIQTLAKLSGLWVDKSEQIVRHTNRLTDHELENIAAGGSEGIAAAPGHPT